MSDAPETTPETPEEAPLTPEQQLREKLRTYLHSKGLLDRAIDLLGMERLTAYDQQYEEGRRWLPGNKGAQ